MAYNIRKRASLSIRIIISVVLIVFFIFAIRGSILSLQRLSEGKEILSSLKKEVTSEKKEQDFLRERIAYVKTDKFIEEQAREKLGLVKEGEYIVIAPSPPEKKKDGPEAIDDTPNWKKWWKLFF